MQLSEAPARDYIKSTGYSTNRLALAPKKEEEWRNAEEGNPNYRRVRRDRSGAHLESVGIIFDAFVDARSSPGASRFAGLLHPHQR
jgi:hypothetical protein